MSSHTCPMRTCGWRTSQVLSHKKTSCSVEASLFYLKHFSWKYAKRHCRLNLTHIWAVWPKPWPLCTSHSYQENQTVGPDYVQSFPNSCLIIRIKCLQVGNKDLEIKNCTFISSPRIINEDFFIIRYPLSFLQNKSWDKCSIDLIILDLNSAASLRGLLQINEVMFFKEHKVPCIKDGTKI